jgi:hypothetical protein
MEKPIIGVRYQIFRCYQMDEKETEVIMSGLTLFEAQEHCKDKETSSRTCTSFEGRMRTAEHGHWFEGYREMSHWFPG